MNILYFFKEKDSLMDKWQRVHIFKELEKHECKIEVLNPLIFSSVEEANEELIKKVKSEKIDLVMTPHNEKTLFIDTIKIIKKKSIPTLLICFDNLVIPFEHKKVAKYFDLVWLTSKETEGMFKKWGANTLFLPYAANPDFFKPNYQLEINKIGFIGTPYGSRVNMINALINNDISLNLHANFNKVLVEKLPAQKNQKYIDYIKPGLNLIKFDIGRRIILGAVKQKIEGNIKLNISSNNLEILKPVGLENLSTLYSNYSLALSSTAARNTGILKNPVNIVNLRSFEVPMSGGLQFCEYFDELAGYFEEDKEIIFYRTEEEMIDKAKFYLRDENYNLRLKMKNAARLRAENNHTWHNRFLKAFERLGLEG